MGFPGSSAGKESASSAEDPGSTPGSGRSPGEGIDYLHQYSRLKNSEEPGRLQSIALERARHDWVTKHSTAHIQIKLCCLTVLH